MTPENPQKKFAARQEVGWNEEWKAISGDSLAAAVYQTHKSRVAANAALEMGPMLAGGEIDLVEMELVMEAAKKAAVEAGLAAGGDTGRDTDIRGFVSRFVPEQLAKIRRPFELESGAEQEQQAQRCLVQTGLLMVDCFDPRLGLDDLSNLRNLIPSLVEGLKLVGLADVPAPFSDWSRVWWSQESTFISDLRFRLQRWAGELNLDETVFKFRQIPRPDSAMYLDDLFSAEMVYSLVRHPGVRQKLAAAEGQGLKLCARLLVEPLKDQFDWGVYERGAGPNGEGVEGFGRRGLAESFRIIKLFPNYPYREGKYWRVNLFPFESCRVPRRYSDSRDLSIFKFHLDSKLAEHILQATAAEGPEKLRMALAKGQESRIITLKEFYGMTVPELGIESDSRGLGRRLDKLGRRLGQDGEIINLDVMLGMLSDPLKIVENPGIDRIVDFRGDYSGFKPQSRLPAAGDEAGREKWVVDKGDMPRVWVCLQIAKKLLPYLGLLAQAEKEGRVNILSPLRQILRYPGTEARDRLPQLNSRLVQLEKGPHQAMTLEELLAAYQPDEQSLKTLVEAEGVDLRMITFAEIRRAGGCLSLSEAMAKLGDERLRKLVAEAILVNDFGLFGSSWVSDSEVLAVGLERMLNYRGRQESEDLAGQIVNIRGKPEATEEARKWLSGQPMRVREYIRYLVSYRLLLATATGELGWPDNRDQIYQEAVRWLHDGREYDFGYPAVGYLLEYLSGLDSVGLGFTPVEVEQITPMFGKLGLPMGEWKYDQWGTSREAQKTRRAALLTADRSDWRRHPEWMNRFLTASYQVCELLTRKLQGEAVLAQAEKNFELGLENLAGLEKQIGVLDVGALLPRFTEMRLVFSKLPADSRMRAEVMKNVIGQLGAEGEKMRRARKSDEQIFEEWLKRVFIPLYKRSGGK